MAIQDSQPVPSRRHMMMMRSGPKYSAGHKIDRTTTVNSDSFFFGIMKGKTFWTEVASEKMVGSATVCRRLEKVVGGLNTRPSNMLF